MLFIDFASLTRSHVPALSLMCDAKIVMSNSMLPLLARHRKLPITSSSELGVLKDMANGSLRGYIESSLTVLSHLASEL